MALKESVLEEYLSTRKVVNIKKDSKYNNYRVFDDPTVKLSVEEKDKSKDDVELSENDNFSSLSGLQRIFLFFIYECCKKSGSRITEPLSIDNISISCGISKKSIQKTAQRLENKGKIKREGFKVGRGGWTKYNLPVEVYNEIMRYDNNKHISGLNIEHDTSGKTDKTHTDLLINSLPKAWMDIKYNYLEKIGFSDSQLKQLYNKKLNTPEVIQSSINHFSFGLENRRDKFSKYTDPLSVIMSVLREGGSWIEKDYETPQSISLRKVIAEKRRQKEEYDRMIKELVELEFPDWRNRLSDEDIRVIVPEQTLKSKFKSATTSALMTYFTNKVLLPRLEQETGDATKEM